LRSSIAEFHSRKYNMAKQVFESLDLVRIIYSFGDPSHRAFTESLKWDLKSWPDVLYAQFRDHCLRSCYSSYSFNEYLYEVSTEKIKQYNRSFLRCYCCARHNQDKRYLKTERFTQIVWRDQAVFENGSSECECKCRHSNRICTDHLYYREVLEE
jgi:hypothetical protein